MKKCRTIVLPIITVYYLIGITCKAEESFKFNWGNDQVSVVETIKKKGNELKLSYSVRAIKVTNGFEIRKSDFYILSINGEGVPESAIEDKLISALMTPDIIVDAKGEPIEAINMEDYIERVASLDPKLRAAFSNPSVLEVLYLQAFEPWCLWVCLWIDLNLEPGESRTEEVVLETMGGELPQTEVVSNFGPIGNSKMVELSIKTQLGGPETAKKLTEMGDRITADLNTNPARDYAISDVNRTTNVTAIIDIKTLKPKSVKEVTRVSTVGQDGERKIVEDSKEYKFYWD